MGKSLSLTFLFLALVVCLFFWAGTLSPITAAPVAGTTEHAYYFVRAPTIYRSTPPDNPYGAVSDYAARGWR